MWGALFARLDPPIPIFALDFLSGWRNRESVPVVLYHSVEDRSENHLLNSNVHRVSVDVFERQIDFLARHFTIISVNELIGELAAGRNVKRVAAVTFDDAYASVLRNAQPILVARRIPFTVFVSAAFIRDGISWRDRVRWIAETGRTREFLKYFQDRFPDVKNLRESYFIWDSKDPARVNGAILSEAMISFIDAIGCQDEVRALSNDLYCSVTDIIEAPADYVTFGNHSANHFVLSALSKAEQELEVEEGHRFLVELGITPGKVFGIPFGGSGSYNADTLEILREFGYTGCLLADNQINRPPIGVHEKSVSGPPCLHRFMPKDDMRGFLKQLFRG